MSGKTNTDKKKSPNDAAYKKQSVGAISELGTNLYSLGTSYQGKQYPKTTTAITDYVIRTYSKAMGQLMNGKDAPPKQPDKPDKKPEEMDPWDVRVFEKQLDQWVKDVSKYKEDKGKVFYVIKGQCTLAMRNKLESLSEYKSLDDNDDVIGLLKAIKDLTYSTTSAKYGHWNLTQCLTHAMFCRQHEQEGMPTYYKRWKTNMEVVEDLWGDFTPTKLDAGADGDDEKHKFQACLFLNSLCAKKYGKLVDELNNSYLAGHDDYPATVESAISMVAHRMDRDHKSNTSKTPDDHDGETETSFAQTSGKKKRKQLRRIICDACGGRGHTIDDCPNANDSESDTESSVESSSALQTRPPTPYRDRETSWYSQY